MFNQLAFLVILANVPCHSATTSIYSYAFGKQYIVTITDEAFRKSPVWRATEENPPLSAKKAIKLAYSLRETLVKDTDSFAWGMKSASLIPSLDDKWYWLITYEAQFQLGGSSGTPHSLRLVVLMDGTVVKPEVKDHP